jgi:trans-AT polyketide synthase/acyltransferase/oxidoreductase domain-containing protein
MSHDICVEADSGGHTDGAIPTVILPTMIRLRDRIQTQRKYVDRVCVGLAGGIGTPEAVAAAFLMGADFILTGSINQCTPEAGISEDAKKLLLDMNIQDTDYAPAGDMFETGAKVQVLRKGVFFPARANKLYGLYTHFDSLGELPAKIQQQLQTTYFKRSFADIWNDMKVHLEQEGKQSDVQKAESNPKYKMSLVFRWYFHYSAQLTFAGNGQDLVNYQLHTGPALGAFNQWVKGTDLEPLANRHADEIGKRLMTEAAQFINQRYASMAECARPETEGGG